MKKLFGGGWKLEAIGLGSNTVLFGVNIFNYEWQKTGKQVNICDPEHNLEQIAYVYTAVIDGRKRKFAVCEISMDVYGFYLYRI